MTPRLAPLLLVLALAACAPRQQQTASTPAPDEPPPAQQRAFVSPAPPAAPPQSAAGARISSAIRFTGFGPAHFGADEEAVRQAWGPPGLADGPPDADGTCHYLYSSPEGRTDLPSPIAFMLVDGKFARLDVHGADYAAPGGGRVGMGEAEIRSRYRGRLAEQPHKYVEGKYLIASPKKVGEARLVFETDATGTVTEWRIGLPEPVHWVEGCS